MTMFRAYVAVYLILRRNNEVLLLQRKNTGFDDGKWSLPAGHVEENESAMTAMIREANEEIGITLLPSDLSLVYTLHRKSGERVYIDFWFEADSSNHLPLNKEPHKCQQLSWSLITNLPELTQNFVKQVLTEYPLKNYGSIGIEWFPEKLKYSSND
nr:MULTISPECIES: NUDIX domain-containing protein [Providencia]